MATYRNVTDRKRREEELSRFRRVVETAPHAIFLTDREGTITYVNPAFEEVTGYPESEVLGQTPRILKSGEMPDTLYEEMWETITAGDVWDGYVINQRATNELYHTHETIAPITDGSGEVREFVAIQTDITERVERERLVGKLDRVLRHDLRNKLNVIETHGDLIRAQETDGLSEHVDKILQSVDDLLETTEKGRGIIKLLSRPTHREHSDVASVTRDVVSDIQSRYPEADVTLDLPEEAPVTAVSELDEAIEELLVNAIEHNDQLRPEVSVRVLVDETVRVRIADNGPGISEMERDVLGENEEIDQLYHGSGFGLWFVYWILRRSHGTITIEDSDSRGTIVTLEFERLRGTDRAPSARETD